MKEIVPGHEYELDCLDGDAVGYLTFVRRVGKNYPGNKTPQTGYTTQEVLRALIARAKYVDRQIPCAETERSINLMRQIIFLYEQRAKRVKGKTLNRKSSFEIEFAPTCKVCGHILCEEHVRG